MQSAQTYACTKLARRYPEEYRKYYLEAKTIETRGNSYSAAIAKTKLSQNHREDYLKLYAEGIVKGYPRRLDRKKTTAKQKKARAE